MAAIPSNEPPVRARSILSDLSPRPQTYLPTLVTVVGVVATLYFGREIFLPIAIALLLTFALAPLVTFLRKRGVPRVAAVIASVLAAFLALGLFSFVVALQVSELAQNAPTYQTNIIAKIRSLKENGATGGLFDRLGKVMERVGEEIEEEVPAPPSAEEEQPAPIPVEVVTRPRPLEVLQSLIAPVIGPLATTGLVIVVVIFMLMEREDLRDRFIRLAGHGDLHRTTEALQDAGRRVGKYLLMQLVVNVTYAIPITIGLWILGIPNALLWGLLTMVLRFVPYIGPAIGMLLPISLAVAVSPGWSLVLWTAGLFLVVELISNNIVEPWLYGSRTGLSPLAVIVSAIFWTWLWGPLGLVLSTPLTVCLVVLGKHVPQFEFLDVLFGNHPVLEPHARLYQRLLAGDPAEATDHAEELLKDADLVAYYETVAIPALLLGERDRARGVMTDEQRRKLAASAQTLVANLDDMAQEESEADDDAAEEADAESVLPRVLGEDGQPEKKSDLPDGTGKRVLCVGGRGELDDAAAAMLVQVLAVQGAEAVPGSFSDLEPVNIRNLGLERYDSIVIGFLNPDSTRHARIQIRRLKRTRPGLRVGLVFWSDAEGPAKPAAPEDGRLQADFIAWSMKEAVQGALADLPPATQAASPPSATSPAKMVRVAT